MSRFKTAFAQSKKLLSIYVTAGYPALEDTVPIIEKLANNGVDIIEIGMPFSDPLADGEIIQASSLQALNNGMSVTKLFEQLEGIREKVSIPLVLMGYVNPVLQYGVEAFCKKCQAIGIDGVILPDLPIEFYETNYKTLFEKHGLSYIGLITPQTPDNRIEKIVKASSGFVYLVSSASTTGVNTQFGNSQDAYFDRIGELHLQLPTMVGFGVKDKTTFDKATKHANGAIIGSAFIKHIGIHGVSEGSLSAFVKQIVN
jgi:tryptophan synthase alpha chain